MLQHKRWMAALMSLMFAAAACTERGGEPAKVAPAAEPVKTAGTTPVTIACGPGQQAIVKQVSANGGQTVSRVECVGAPVPRSREVSLLDDQIQVAPPKPKAPPRTKVKRPLPPLQARPDSDTPMARAPEPPREIPRVEPRYRDMDENDYDRDADAADATRDGERPAANAGNAPATATDARVGQKRGGEKSALIIAGSTAAGAGVGAIVGGKKGALLGAVLGGIGGAVFDHKTRDAHAHDGDHEDDN